ncbi:hypothetical protein GH714_026566 [Hevea brasiliensis]|uniref:Cytochrome P450 n=1 Tax=Hevea brasiliensis TaxID=3981 RepID=A0A6A6KE86_HEVBR|nr:hypothetical protein GH714_026566 [Hevea brasiliensis]
MIGSSTRPSSIASKYLGYNGAMFGLSPYGPYWRDIRKLAILELLSNNRLEKLKHVRVSEVETGVRNLYVLCTNGRTGSTVVDMDQWFSNMTMNLMIRMIAGKPLIKDEESERFCRATKNFMHLLGVVVISDLIPGTEWLDLQGHARSMKRTAKDMDYFISRSLSVPREAMEDCYVGGFYVPKGTRLLVNIWKLHRDPRIWRNPNEFHPERFLACEGHEFDVRGQNFEYIPSVLEEELALEYRLA